MSDAEEIDDDHFDDKVDEVIGKCLSPEEPTSFFVFAGAGSGKTRSLVEAIKVVRTGWRKQMMVSGQRLGVITFTNKACEEIQRRIDFDGMVKVSTIHSFVWGLIQGFDEDIKEWLKGNLVVEIAELEAKQAKSRGANKTTEARARKIESKQRRLAGLDGIIKFTYNPNGDNLERDSLGHAEVINITSDFLIEKELMQEILANRFPVLLIDESQDTKGKLLDSLMAVERALKPRFTVGLFGDRMQQIYHEAKADLGEDLPADWKQPVKEMNHRSTKRVIRLINRIREPVDGQEQRARSDSDEGVVRLFVLSGTAANKMELEGKISAIMADCTGDPRWNGEEREVTTLILEHHMAAERLGFDRMFDPLYCVDRLRTGLLDGTLPELRVFSDCVLSVVSAAQLEDDFRVADVMRNHSPLLDGKVLKRHGKDQMERVREAQDSVAALSALWEGGGEPTFRDVLELVVEKGLFVVPDSLKNFVGEAEQNEEVSDGKKEDVVVTDRVEAWNSFLDTPFSQIRPYRKYIDGEAGFDTHQGVKGLEFPRVMVVMDDEKARGFLFSYEKLFGARAPTQADLAKEKAGKDTGLNRTRRLFYVTSSRAAKSLALVAYSSDPAAVRSQVINDGWFEDGEVVEL